MRNRQRVAAVLAAAVLATGGGIAAPAMASASTKLTCNASAGQPREMFPNTFTAAGQAKATPGSSYGLSILGQNVERIDIEVVLMEDGVIVAGDGEQHEGRSQLGQMLNNINPVKVNYKLRARAGVGLTPNWHTYETYVIASCRSTNGAWVTDEARSRKMISHLDF
jgi:hypothetical protein